VALVIYRHLAKIQASVTFAGNFTRNLNIEIQLTLIFEHCHLDVAISAVNILALVGCKQGIIDLEIEVVCAVFQALIGY
jgi:hypothetical protein